MKDLIYTGGTILWIVILLCCLSALIDAHSYYKRSKKILNDAEERVNRTQKLLDEYKRLKGIQS